MDFVGASANTGTDFERRSFLKPREQPNHEIKFRRMQKSPDLPKSTQHDSRIKTLDPFGLLQTLPINPMRIPAQQSKLHQNFTIPPTWSREHKASFPPAVLPVPLSPSCPNPCKSGRGHKEATKRVTDVNGLEVLKPSQGANRPTPAIANSHHINIKPIMDHIDTGLNLRRSDTESVCLDKFEAEMKVLTFKLIRERYFRREIVLGSPENRCRIRVKVDAASTSPEEMEQARQSTTIRGALRAAISASRCRKG